MCIRDSSLAEVTLCVFRWAVFPYVVFLAAAPLARFRLPLLLSRFGGPLPLALFARFPMALWLIVVASFLCVLYHLWLFTAYYLLVCSGDLECSETFDWPLQVWYRPLPQQSFTTAFVCCNNHDPVPYERVFKRAKFARFSHLSKANNILVDCFTGFLNKTLR